MLVYGLQILSFERVMCVCLYKGRITHALQERCLMLSLRNYCTEWDVRADAQTDGGHVAGNPALMPRSRTSFWTEG